MKVTTNTLTSLTALCVFGIGSDWATQEKHFDRPIVEKTTGESAVADTMFPAVHCNEQADDPRFARVSTPGKVAQSSSKALQEPTFLKEPLLFTPNHVNLNTRSRNTVQCAAAWLREHHEARILIVGYCDDSGSEACTTPLAERRAQAVRQFLVHLGTQADQIAGVKRWENLDRPCRIGATGLPTTESERPPIRGRFGEPEVKLQTEARF